MRMQSDSQGRVICGQARFTLLGEGLVRIEHDKEGLFDDRPTLRAIALPSPSPFRNVEFSETGVTLTGDGFKVIYEDAAELSGKNLKIEWQKGGMEGAYKYGDLDYENLGAVTTLDHFYDAMVPNGVHPGGSQGIERRSELNLWPTGQAISAYCKEHQGEFKLQKPLLWTSFHRYDKLPDALKKEADIWKKCPPGPISKAGYWTLDETGMYHLAEDGWLDENVRDGYADLYFGCYGRDYKLAMRQYSSLLGKAPLLPRWAFGNWYSRFYHYTEKEFKDIVKKHEKHGLPLDVLIVDIDWHINGWSGWEWNKEMIPDPKAFCEWKDQVGIHIGPNLHDEYIVREDAAFKAIAKDLGIAEDSMEQKDESAEFAALSEKVGTKVPPPRHDEGSYYLDYRDRKIWDAMQKYCYGPNDDMGIDFWWQDNWQGIFPHGNLNLWKYELLKRRQEKQGRRPMFLGRYAGLGSHRYPALFSGDTGSQWPVLEMEADVNIRAAHTNLCYFSHDLGGFKGEVFCEGQGHISPELYVRWLQMGALCPVMRVHSDHGVREPWNYAPQIEEIAKEAYLLHHSLVPYFYQLARESYDTGYPVHRPVYFEQPECEESFSHPYEYFVGDKLFFSPVKEQGGFHTVNLPKGEYLHYKSGEKFTGPMQIEDRFHMGFIPLYVKAGSIIPTQDFSKRQGIKAPDPLVFAVYPGGSDTLSYYEDDGISLEYPENFSRLNLTHTEETKKSQISADPIIGSYKGMKTGRNLRFDFHFVDKPQTVVINDQKGQREVEFSYDEKTRLLKVALKAQSLKSPFDLTVTFE